MQLLSKLVKHFYFFFFAYFFNFTLMKRGLILKTKAKCLNLRVHPNWRKEVVCVLGTKFWAPSLVSLGFSFFFVCLFFSFWLLLLSTGNSPFGIYKYITTQNTAIKVGRKRWHEIYCLPYVLFLKTCVILELVLCFIQWGPRIIREFLIFLKWHFNVLNFKCNKLLQ